VFPGNILGTFYKISDYGLIEKGRALFDALRKEKARKSIALDKKLMAMTPEQKMVLYLSKLKGPEGAQIKRKIRRILLKEKNTAWASLISSARSEEEMDLVINMMAAEKRD